jgi:hypothetical protein
MSQQPRSARCSSTGLGSCQDAARCSCAAWGIFESEPSYASYSISMTVGVCSSAQADLCSFSILCPGDDMASQTTAFAAAIACMTFASGVWAQATTPGGGPNSGVKDAIHPPSLSAPDADRHAPSRTPKTSGPYAVTKPESGQYKRKRNHVAAASSPSAPRAPH